MSTENPIERYLTELLQPIEARLKRLEEVTNLLCLASLDKQVQQQIKLQITQIKDLLPPAPAAAEPPAVPQNNAIRMPLKGWARLDAINDHLAKIPDETWNGRTTEDIAEIIHSSHRIAYQWLWKHKAEFVCRKGAWYLREEPL